MTADDAALSTSADVEAVSAIIEAHLSTGLGCRCDQWRIDTTQRPVDPRRQHRRHVAEVLAAALSTPPAEGTGSGEDERDESLARALLTLATVESAVRKIERYLETNGRYLSLDAKVPMERQTEAMRNALNAWKADRTEVTP